MGKILVTGGEGFIGSHLVDKLINFGGNVFVVDNESAINNEQFYKNDKARYFKMDVSDYKSMEQLFRLYGFDYVYHLAASARIQPSIENPIGACQTNIMGTLNILELSKRYNIKKVVYSSTSSAYGLKNTPPLREDMPNDCLNVYSVSKTAGEDLCKVYYKNYGLKTVILRYFNVYGDRQPIKGEYATVIGKFLEQYKNGEPLTVVGDGEQRRDFTHIDDVTVANMKAILHDDENLYGEIINIGSGENYSINEIVFHIWGKKKYIPERTGEAKETLADIYKAKKYLDWNPQKSLKNYLYTKVKEIKGE